MSTGTPFQPQERQAEIAARLIAASGFSLEKMPVLGDAFTTAAATCAAALRQFCPSDIEVRLEGVSLRDSPDEGAPPLHAEFEALDWDAPVVVALERTCVDALVDALFGGDGRETFVAGERPLSNVETRVARLLADEFARALERALPAGAGSRFAFRAMTEPSERLAEAPPASAEIVAAFGVEIFGRPHPVEMRIPQVLQPLRQALARPPAVDKPASANPGWSRRIGDELKRAGVTVRAVLEEPDMMLADIAALRVGEVLRLQTGPETRIKLESSDQPLFWGELGQGNGAFTVRIQSAIDPEQEFIDHILPR